MLNKDGRINHPVHKETHKFVIAPARVAALEALMDVELQDAFAGLALSKRIQSAGLSALDRRLMTELFYGVLENRMRLDYILTRFMQKPMEEDIVRCILRMGVYQLLFMDRIPDNAICNDGVELCKRFDRPQLGALVNAVLRGVARGRESITYPTDPVESLSILHSFPKWMVEKLIAQYGMEGASQILSFRGAQHFDVIRPNLMQMEDGAFETFLTEQGIVFERGIVSNAFRVFGGHIAAHRGFRDGQFSIMGESSMLAVEAMGLKNGMQVLDCCAAPGGKTCYIAEKMNGTGRVYAWDLHEHRVKLIASAAQRLHLDNVRPRIQDAREPLESQLDRMDVVLVDAPCSGLGVYLNKPDIKYRVKQEDIATIAQAQMAILDACAGYVKRGGVLIYSTCTLFSEENISQVRGFLERHPEFEVDQLTPYIPSCFAELICEGTLTLLPHRDGVDGFFIARFVRKRS